MELSNENIVKDLLVDFLDFCLTDSSNSDGDFRIEEEIEVDYSNIDAANISYDATFRDLDSFMHCCPKCHCHPQNNMVNPTNNNGKSSNCSGTSASSASVSISPGHKKLQASALNYIHCHGHGNCFSHKHPNHRANHHQVKMRLKEKSKKKLEEKAAAVSGQGSFIHESINPNSVAFSKFDQMAAACKIQDPSLAMGLLSAAASLSMDPNNIIDYHDHHHHHSHQQNTTAINANSNNQKTMTTTTNNNNHSTAQASQSTSVALSSTNNTVTTTSTTSSKSSTASPSQTSAAIQSSVNTNGKKQLQSTAQQQQQRKTSKSSNHQEDVCTKKDDCNCIECIKRQRIVEELIAEEESSKKKKQKKKKNKNKQNKQSSLASNNDDVDGQSDDGKLIKTDNENIDEKIEEEHQEEIKCKSTTNQSAEETTKSQQKTENFSKVTSIKKNKKNKQQSSVVASSIEPEIVATSSSVTTMTSKNTNNENTSKKKSNKDAAQMANNSENGETVEIQQWIKVKNKSKQNSTNSNQQQNSNTNQNNNNNYPDAWYSSGVDDLDPSGHNNNEDVEGNADGEDNDNTGGFKVIHSDRRRMSSNNNNSSSNNNNSNNNDENSGSNNDGSGCLSSRLNNLNPGGMMAKAKLMAIEAQIAFNNNELKGAVQYISDAIELDGRNPVYFLNRAFFHERLNEFEHALKDTESALRFDESKEYLDHALYLKAKALIGLEQYEKAEQILLKIRSLSCKPKMMPFLEKDLLLLRMKKLVHCSYTIPLARLYAFKYQTIMDAQQALEQNCNLLIEKKLNESDPKYHLMLIQQQQQQRSSFCWPDDSDITLASSSQLKILEEETKPYITLNNVDYDDDELYFSDDDERQIWYSHPDHWHQPKDIFKKEPVQFEDTKEPPNSKGQKALWIGNVSPSCSLTFVTNLFMKFGNVTFCKIFPNEQRTTGDVAYLLLHYDNDISPRLVMSYFKDKIVPGISKDDSCPLLIRFRNKNDKLDETNGDLAGNSINSSTNMQNFSAPSSTGTAGNVASSLTNSPTTKTVSECYYWRTTGCDRQHCTFRHVIGNKGIDKQAWMRKKN